jgi:hypothetical protein
MESSVRTRKFLALGVAFMLWPATAAADPLPVTTTSPANGATIMGLTGAGQSVPFEVTSPLADLTGVYVEVASQPAPLGQDGTLAADFELDYFPLQESDAYPGTYRGLSNDGRAWAQTPGTYYWQVQGFEVDRSAGYPVWRRVVSPIFALTVVLPACADSLDNDGDDQVDAEDWGCEADADDSEVLTAVPRLGREAAKHLIRLTLRERFARDYRAGNHKRIAGCDRRSRVRMRCRASWSAGDVSWRGRVTVWNSREGETVRWNYSYAIKRTNEACNCTKTIRGRA